MDISNDLINLTSLIELNKNDNFKIIKIQLSNSIKNRLYSTNISENKIYTLFEKTDNGILIKDKINNTKIFLGKNLISKILVKKL